MKFEHSEILLWLWSIVPIFFLFWVAGKRRKRALLQFAQSHLIDIITKSLDSKKMRLKELFFIFAVIFSIIALARPQWGFEWQEISKQGLDILVAIDTSQSMLTQDVKPNRLERAKLAVKDLIGKLQGDRIGVIAFSGEGFLVCPLTTDYSGVMLSLSDLDTDSIPRGGTDIFKAIHEAIKGYENVPGKYKIVIMITDGENLEEDPIPIVKRAKEKGLKIYTIGIGTKEGDLIRIKNTLGESTFLKDADENFVKSRLNENLLQEIALMTGGIYVRASGAQFGLDLIYDQELSKFEKRESDKRMEKKYFERFQIPLSIALFFLLVEITLAKRKKSV